MNVCGLVQLQKTYLLVDFIVLLKIAYLMHCLVRRMAVQGRVLMGGGEERVILLGSRGRERRENNGYFWSFYFKYLHV